MTAMVPQRPAARRWGWGISAVLYALLAINGGHLFFFQLGLATFMEDTGLTLVEVERVFPTVAAYLTQEVRFAAMLLTGMGLDGLYHRADRASWPVSLGLGGVVAAGRCCWPQSPCRWSLVVGWILPSTTWL